MKFNPKWKQRMKNYWGDTKFQMILLGISVGFGAMTELIFRYAEYSFTPFSIFFSVLCISLFVFHGVFTLSNAIDDFTSFDEEEKSHKEEMKNRKNYLDELHDKMWDLRHLFLEISTHNALYELKSTLYHIAKNYPIGDEERLFLTQELPKEILETIALFEALEVEEIKRNTEKKLQNMFIEKKKEIEETFLLPYEKKREEACLEQIEKVSQRQYQRVYIND